MLKPFVLHSPDTVAQTLELLWQHEDAKLVAGGTDVFVEMHNGASYPILIDLKGLNKLNCIEYSFEAGLTIGALATHRELMRSDHVKRYYPALVDAVQTIGSVQVRSRGTVAGNICNASPAADSAGPLMLYDAVVHVAGKDTERTVPITEFFVGPKKNCLQKGEIVTKIVLAPPVPNAGSAYVKLKKRGAMEIGVMSAGVRVATDGAGVCTLARVAMSAVNPTPIRVKAAEDYLVGKKLTPEAIRQAAEEAYAAARPMTWRNSEEWSKDMVKVYVPMAAEKALERMEKGEN